MIHTDISEEEQQVASTFDFANHEKAAVIEYLKVAGYYQDLAIALKRIVEEALKKREIQVHSIEARAKEPASFARKASKPSNSDPQRPKYDKPLEQITDLSAIRVITFFPRSIADIDKMLKEEFCVIEQSNKGDILMEEEKFGYQSFHYLIKLNSTRSSLAEYNRFRDTVAEVQVRTILQHAWAEIEHDIQYKSSVSIPRDIKRRFMALAGLLELADREFQSIQDADRDLTAQASSLIALGDFKQVEITPNALKEYLDKHIGPDGRVSEFSYDWAARILKKLGFKDLDQVDQCIRSYDDDSLSRLIDGNRQGQTTRFEYMLLAGMGEKFIDRHPWSSEAWFRLGQKRKIELLEQNGISIGSYDPLVV